mgnify:CR=1 FL=1
MPGSIQNTQCTITGLSMMYKLKRLPEKICWFLLVKFLKLYSYRYMDQWEKVKFDTDYGTIYVTISHRDDYPDSFDNI